MPPKAPQLPSNFHTIRQLLDREAEDGKLVSIFGVVKDFRLPIQSKGTDFKSTVTLFDLSTEEDNGSIDINIFRKEAEMPKVAAGDIVIVSMAKFQVWGFTPSLMTNFRTTMHVYDAQRLADCRRSKTPCDALKEIVGKGRGVPTDQQTSYVLWVFEAVDKTYVPDREALAARAEQSLNIKDKFSLLQDIRDQKFADLIGQVVKEPFDHGDFVGLWLSDYTENNALFNRMKDAQDSTEGWSVRTGDPYGYMDQSYKKRAKSQVDDPNHKWIGPYGKRSIQITSWEPHAQFIREHVHIGDWVRLRNVQIGFGHNSINLEGFLREDRNFPSRVYVHVFDLEDREAVDPRLKDALRRKRDNETTTKPNATTGEKRKILESTEKINAKTKRAEKRRKKHKIEEDQRAKEEAALNLHELVKCEYQDKTIVPLSSILEPVSYHATINNDPIKLELPFTCAKYRTQVRVVDFHPANVEDFAVGRASSEYEILSDNGDLEADIDSDASSSASCARHDTERRFIWEWRFALKLEEACPARAKNKSPATAWVLVDNLEAQLLTGLDAANLRSQVNEELLKNLRERLFILWGNLEERKARVEAKKHLHNRNPVGAPPADSSDVEVDTGASLSKKTDGIPTEQCGPGSSQLSNRPFTCCLLQYGIRVSAHEADGIDAGDGTRWQRMLKLFGTKVASD